MNGYFKALGSVLALMVLWVAVTLAFGVAARIIKEIFCLGYGC